MPDVSRRRLLQFLGMTPAIPLLSKIPPTDDANIISTENITAASPFGVTGYSGFCVPIPPQYDLPRHMEGLRSWGSGVQRMPLQRHLDKKDDQ